MSLRGVAKNFCYLEDPKYTTPFTATPARNHSNRRRSGGSDCLGEGFSRPQKFLIGFAKISQVTLGPWFEVSTGEARFIGWTSTTGFVQGLCPGVQVPAQRGAMDTCRRSANPCPAFLVADTSARLILVSWTIPVSICPRTGVERLPTPVLQLETHFLTISATLVILYRLLNAILNLLLLLLAHSACLKCSTKRAI